MNGTTRTSPTTHNLCGRQSGYNRHLKDKENPCMECLEAQKVASALYYKANSEKIIKRVKEYRLANLETVKETKARYYRKNSETTKLKSSAYAANNPEKRREFGRRKEHRRRARKFNNGCSPYSESQIFELYGTKCHLCALEIDLTLPRAIGKQGWESGLHIDHLLPLSKGGADTLENVRPSHGKCNVNKAAKLSK